MRRTERKEHFATGAAVSPLSAAVRGHVRRPGLAHLLSGTPAGDPLSSLARWPHESRLAGSSRGGCGERLNFRSYSVSF